jgi:hypothetical protein
MKFNIFKIFQPVLILLISFTLNAQSSIQFKATSIRPGDSCVVIIQKSAENFYQKKLIAGNDSTVSYTFNSISNGKWALKIDATGYYFPPTKVFDITDKNILVEARFVLITLANTVDYFYKWEDDSSYLGHAQQSYINGQPDYKVINDPIKVPDDFSSINLISISGIALSNKITSWSSEDAYRLYQMVKRVPILNASKGVLSTNNAIVNSVWSITDDEVVDDVSINLVNSIKYVTISRKAFVYATPLIAELDGIKGRFFSKRLYKAVISFATNFGNDASAVSSIANQNFGIKFLDPGSELKNLMNEDPSNFQSFSAFEKLTILSMFEELPDGMHAQANLKYIVRRIAGQDNPKYPSAAAIAWTGMQTIEFMQKAFTTSDFGAIQRLILHEKTHFLWAGLFEQKLKDDWSTLGGWYLDPTAPSGWSTTKTTEFVSAYAHALNPNEDMAESVATYVTNPNLLLSRSIGKYEFIRDRVMFGTRYVSMIRKDLTFTVYNLMPDYNYPGKIEGVNISVVGLPNEDKKLIIELKIHAIDSTKDGASYGYTRISSSIGTFFDMYLNQVAGNPFLLRGEITITKFAKNGYWTVNQIMLSDAVGNKRYENNNTFGLKIFINNPQEDLLPAKYKESTLSLSLGKSKFSSFATYETIDGKNYQYVQAKFDVVEKNAISYIGINFAMPTNQKGVYKELQFGVLSGDTNYIKRDQINKELSHITYKYPIPEYYPTGYYPITQIFLRDEAQNEFRDTFMNDTTGYKVNGNQQKHVRDSILIKTSYPDFLPPILDLNAISIAATPTNPLAPNGETLFEMEFFAKDSSEFIGHEAGLQNGYYVLRDPQGKQFGFSMQGDFDNNNFYYLLEDPFGNPGLWRKYKVKTLLPKGSAPGLWGVESIFLNDRAQNSKYFNFVELVRFDLEKADSSLLVNPSIQILGKKVNAKTVDSLSISIACKNCSGKLYRARFYSDMGGESVLSEGIMKADSIVVKNINLRGVNDGVLYATVFILDTSKVLLGIGKAEYKKDVIIPKSVLLKTNLSNFGKSNIDSLLLEIKVSEKNLQYNLVLTQNSITKTNSIASQNPYIGNVNTMATSSAFKVGDSIVLSGLIIDSVTKLSKIGLSNFEDGFIGIRISYTDSAGNQSDPVSSIIYKDTKEPIITIKKSTITDLKATYTIESNEFLSNSLIKDSIKINVGKIDSIAKVGNKLYNVFITRVCNDTLILTVKPNSLLDTVGNKNLLTSITGIEKIIPDNPSVTGLNYCQGAGANQLTANILTGHNSVWYSSSSGTTSSTTAPKPITTNIGKVDYYVSQVKATTGCESSKTKLTVTVFEVPTAPILSRDTANFLVSSATSGNTWYKDSTILKDSTQRIKPLTPGAYNVKTTQNGCVSAISTTYYFLITDILKLSSTEFIKLAPNPFQTKLNFDFLIKGYQKLNLDVFEISTGNKVATRVGLTPGAPINLPELTGGTYIVRITSADGKLSYQFKMVKM